MSLRRLSIPAVLILVLPFLSHAQSLGDVARQVRAERQQDGAPRLKVYTNDDLSRGAAENPARKDGEESANAEAPAGEADKDASHEAREKETEKRAQEIDKQYLDRIAALQAKIDDAQKQLARLQRDQIESTNLYQSTMGGSPADYQQQQRFFLAQIEEQRNLIVNLNSELEDAREAARHAGVRHLGD